MAAKKANAGAKKGAARTPARPGGKGAPGQAGKGALAQAGAQAVKAGTAAEKRAERLLGLIARRKARIAEDFYDIGEALRELQKKKLYLVLGHASFAEMLKARDILGLSQAKKLIRIVESIPRDKALSVGAEKAYALVRYTAATPEPDTPEQLLDDGAAIGGKRVGDLSLRELTAATGKVRAQAAGPKKRDPEEQRATAAARKTQAALRKRGMRTATVTARRAKGVWRLVIELPVESAEALLVGA